MARDTVDARTATAGATVEVRKSTSGTMGRPLVFGYERASEYWRQAMKLRGYGWAGYRAGHRSLHFWGAGPPPPAPAPGTTTERVLAPRAAGARASSRCRPIARLRREHYVDCGRRGAAELDAVVEIIRAEKPEVILCYSQAGADLARHVNARGLRDWGTIPVLCGAERLLPTDRIALTERRSARRSSRPTAVAR